LRPAQQSHIFLPLLDQLSEQAPIKPFTESIHVLTLGWQLDRFHPGDHQRLLKFLPKEGIPIMDKPVAFWQKSVFAIRQVSRHLNHPFLRRITHNPTNIDLPLMSDN